MKLNDAKIESLLRQAPPVAPPAGLYERLETDLRAQAFHTAEPARIPPKQIFRFASMMIFCLTAVALGSGIYLVVQPRVLDWNKVPEERLRGVADPYIPHPEDLLPIPLALHVTLLDLMQRSTDHEKSTGQKNRWMLVDVQPDGTSYWWTQGRPELWEMGFHANQHPNDWRGLWSYNFDGSPIPIKKVTPHGQQRWRPGDVRDGDLPVGDGYDQGSGYWVEMEKPKDSLFFNKRLLFERSWAKWDGQQWKLVLKGFQLGSRGTPGGGTAHVASAVVLPAGAEFISSSRPFQEKLLDADKRPTLRFDDPTPKDGNVPPIEISYRYQIVK